MESSKAAESVVEKTAKQITFPLLQFTSSRWARAALESPYELLNDHAHLEKKAAANALELLCRWPDKEPPDHWVRAMSSMAAEEADHLKLVSGLLLEKGWKISRNHKNLYAGQLHRRVRRGGRKELADRLYVAALIELRSCERFQTLAREAAESHPWISRLYASLMDSEVGHYHAFLRLAREVDPEPVWSQWLQAEAEIMAGLPFFPGILSGEPGSTDTT
ncbi:MAG: hypothetical protein KDK23_11060 [Leptospiraceae bacterium]|nr:hypothetical protein [Leptospiraceae bacterium]